MFKALLISLLFTPAAFAKTYVCYCVRASDEIRVHLDLDNTEKSGKIEVNALVAYPALILVSTKFHIKQEEGHALLTSQIDGAFNYQAKMVIPSNYRARDVFPASLVVTRSSAGPIKSELDCTLK